MAALNIEDRIAALKAKRDKIADKHAQIRARQQTLEAQLDAINRKESTRKKILVGAAILTEVRERIAKNPKDPFALEVQHIVDRRVMKPADRAVVFGRRNQTSPGPSEAEGEAAS